MDALIRTITGTVIRASIFKSMRGTSMATAATLAVIAAVFFVVAG